MQQVDWQQIENWIEKQQIGRWQAAAPLAEFTSWRIGGPARLMVWPETEEKCAALLQYGSQQGADLRFLGSGTNLLAADEGVEALVIHTGALRRLEWAGKEVQAGAGLPLAQLSKAAADRSLKGLEFAIGIPGSLGGALMMNAGAYGGQMSDLVLEVRAMDKTGRIRVLQEQELSYGYRESRLKHEDLLILSGRLGFKEGNQEESLALMKEYLEARRQKQPLDLPNGGSVFRNPAGGGAGRYIEQAGLKGLQIGKAQISPKHANFIVNLGGAKAAEVSALMDRAQKEVAEKFGVRLESEVICWR